MNFSELTDAVIAITRRPDLLTRTQSAVQAATLKAHHQDFFYKDLVEVTIEFEQPGFISNFAPTDVVPRFRKAKYLRIWEGLQDGFAGPFLKQIQIENSLDGYGLTKSDVYYTAGQLIQIRTCRELTRALFGCYVHPSIVTSAYSSWIAIEEPWAIIYEAARQLLKEIGHAELANQMAEAVAEVYRNLQISYVDDLAIT